MILTLATLTVRIIGVVQRVPLYHLLKAEGMGIVFMPYPVYAVMLAVSSVGINIAISRLIAERLALGDAYGARRVFRVSLWMMFILGLILSAALFASAGFLATEVHRNPMAYLSYLAISPAVFFVAIMSAYRGYFQGLQRMTPNGASQVIEQIIRVVTMLTLPVWLLPRGLDWAAAGANLGAVTGAIGAWLYLMWVYYRSRNDDPRMSAVLDPAVGPAAGATAARESVLELAVKIVKVSAPVALAGSVLPLIQLADAALVPSQLQAAGFSVSEATSQFGRLSNIAFPLVNLPTILTSALFVALVPAIAELAALGDYDRIRFRAETAMRITFIFSLPAMVGLYILATPISGLIYGDFEGGGVLRALTSGLLFLTLQQTTSGVLQGLGEMTVPVRNMLIGAAVKTILTFFLAGSAFFGVDGAAYATVIGFFIAAGMNITALTVRIGPVLRPADMIIKPGLAVSAMGVAARGVYAWMFGYLGDLGLSVGRANALATLGSISVAAGVYGLTLLLAGGVKAADLEMIPKVGHRLAGTLQALGILRG